MPERPEDGREMIRKAERLLEQLYCCIGEQKEGAIHQGAELLLRRYETPVRKAQQDLKITESSVRWFFSSGDAKKRAFASYNYLTDVLELGLGPELQRLLSEKGH